MIEKWGLTGGLVVKNLVDAFHDFFFVQFFFFQSLVIKLI
jgi:hypothetical protein